MFAGEADAGASSVAGRVPVLVLPVVRLLTTVVGEPAAAASSGLAFTGWARRSLPARSRSISCDFSDSVLGRNAGAKPSSSAGLAMRVPSGRSGNGLSIYGIGYRSMFCVANDMYLFQIVAGRLPPVSLRVGL